MIFTTRRHNINHRDSRSPLQRDGVVTWAHPPPPDHPAQLPLAGRFGPAIRKERRLRGGAEASFGGVSGQQATELNRIPRGKPSRLGANRARWKERDEAPADSGRVTSRSDRRHLPRTPRRTVYRDEAERLPDLIGVRVLAGPELLPPTLLGWALILTLLYLINSGVRHYH